MTTLRFHPSSFGATRVEIPGYKLVGEAGRGGMATVYIAIQESLGRQVALKVMNESFAADASLHERFLKEGRIIARFQTPRIITVHDLGSCGGQYYLSMEYLPGGTLKERIDSGLTIHESARIIRQIAHALSYAHRLGVIHRDIKPRNILFREGYPVLTDFGIAMRLDGMTRLTPSGVMVGSPHYMSPEQINGQSVDGRSDLYSLGVLFHQMLTGRLPYEADDLMGLVVRHCTAPIPVLPESLSGYQSLIERLLAKDPKDRLQSAEELVGALDEADADASPAHTVSTRRQTPGPVDESTVALTSVPPEQPVEQESAGRRRVDSRVKRPLLLIGFIVLLGVAGVTYWRLAERLDQPGLLAPKTQVQEPIKGRASALKPAVDVPAIKTLAGTLKEIFGQLDCTDLHAQVIPADDPMAREASSPMEAAPRSRSQIVLAGYVPDSSAMNRLRERLVALPSVTKIDDTAVEHAAPFCALIARLRGSLAATDAADVNISVRLNHPDRLYRDRDLLAIDVTASVTGYLYLDLFDAGDQVLHLLPTPRTPGQDILAGTTQHIGAEEKVHCNGSKECFEIWEPYGNNMVVALWSSAPIFHTPRGTAMESAATYRTALTEAVEAMSGDARFAVHYRFFSNRP